LECTTVDHDIEDPSRGAGREIMFGDVKSTALLEGCVAFDERQPVPEHDLWR
jgi:hypothetical protein